FETVPRKLSGLKALGLMKDGKLCVQTADASAAGPAYRLETYDGRAFEPLTGPLASSPLDGGASAVLEGQNGDLGLGGPQGTAWYHDKKWRSFPSADKTAPEAVLSFVELPDGRVWCATPDKIWEFDGRNWSVARGGFDRINGLRRTRDGSVWVASNNGLHHFIQGALVEKGAWVENGIEEGLPAASVRQVYEDPRGRLWAATTHGLSLYHPETDLDPPHTHIQNLSQRERNVPEGSTVNLSFSGQDKWNHTPRHRLLYSYRL